MRGSSATSGHGTTSSLLGSYILAGEISKYCGGEDGKDGLDKALKAYEDKFQPFMTQVQAGLLDDNNWWIMSNVSGNRSDVHLPVGSFNAEGGYWQVDGQSRCQGLGIALLCSVAPVRNEVDSEDNRQAISPHFVQLHQSVILQIILKISSERSKDTSLDSSWLPNEMKGVRS